MKRILLVLPLLTLLAACAVSPSGSGPAPVEATTVSANTEVVPAPTEPPAEMPSLKLPAAPFEAQTYIDEKNGFAFDYPSGWTVTEAMVSERAKQVQFLSSPDLANVASLPEGATRLSTTVYDWEPKNDLPAYVANWKTAWGASGFTILDEQQLTLEQGLPAVQFTVQTPDATVVFLVTALKDRYLVLSGEGNLELVKEIVGRLRPIS